MASLGLPVTKSGPVIYYFRGYCFNLAGVLASQSGKSLHNVIQRQELVWSSQPCDYNNMRLGSLCVFLS